MPSYSGTLAAVRSLGKRGVPVILAGAETYAPARFSRYVTRWIRCPSPQEKDRFIDWLLEFGRRSPGHVLYPTSDDLTFIFAKHASQLAPFFRLYQPPLATVLCVLDKKALNAACHKVGLDTAPTWVPENESDLDAIAEEASFPLLIKARTQVMRRRQTKGRIVWSRSDLIPQYRAFLAEQSYQREIESCLTDVQAPLIQNFINRGAERVYSVTGFIDSSGKLFEARAAVKVFQRTRPVGLGICFESSSLDELLLEKVRRLCMEVGHYGVFEIELVRDDNRDMVIDFNPRLFGQIGFDEARGLPSPYLSYLDAIGDTASLRQGIAEAALSREQGARIYCHKFLFEMILLAKRLGGRSSIDEHRYWRRWLSDHAHQYADASADPYDWVPGLMHSAREIWAGFKALRNFIPTPHFFPR